MNGTGYIEIRVDLYNGERIRIERSYDNDSGGYFWNTSVGKRDIMKYNMSFLKNGEELLALFAEGIDYFNEFLLGEFGKGAEFRSKIMAIHDFKDVKSIYIKEERLRMNMTLFRYRILSIGKGRKQLTDYMEVVKPEFERYTGIIKTMKEKNSERKSLAAEKKATPVLQFSKLRVLSKRITGLTEELEELRSEKEMLLNRMQCDESGISGIKKDLSNAEVNLKKLDDAELRYKTELENACREFAELQETAKDFDPNELLIARLKLRQDFDTHAASTIQQIFGRNYDWLTMHDSRQYVSDLLKEDELDLRSVQKQLRQAELDCRKQAHEQNQPRQRKPREQDYER